MSRQDIKGAFATIRELAEVLNGFAARRTDIHDEGRAIEADRGKPKRHSVVNLEHHHVRMADPKRAKRDRDAIEALIDAYRTELQKVRADKGEGRALKRKEEALDQTIRDLERLKADA